MTISMTRTHRGAPRDTGPGNDVRARREAALGRLNGGTAAVRASAARAGGAAPVRARRVKPSRVKPSRRAVQRTTPKAIEQLGPAPGLYYAIIVIVAVFVMLGLVMVLSATSANQVGGTDSPYQTFNKQAMWAGLGLLGMLLTMAVPYQRWRAFVIPGAVLAAGGMMLPFVPGVGVTINDARSWVRFGSFGFQPSEIMKLAAIALLADHFARHQDELHEPRRGIVPLGFVAAVCCGMSFAQGDLGSAIVLGAAIMAVGVIAGVPLFHVGSLATIGGIGALLAIVSDPRRFNRLTAFRDIEGNKEHLAWQSWQGLLGIANGGLTGSGIGGSRAKMGYLPLAHSDFIFAVIADELGFIGSVAVIGGFGLLVWFGIQTALAAPDTFGLVLAGGIAVWFGVQAIVNIGGVAGVMPVTGLTLPFFSAGGTSLFVSMVAALLLNVARRAVTVPRGVGRQPVSLAGKRFVR
jgi:cell division protein FtsW